MSCLDENSVVEYLNGWLAEESRAQLEVHIDQCPACRELVSEVVRGTSSESETFQPGDELSPGARIEHFQVKRLLGRGRMGEVYLCRDTQLGRRVALKVVRPESLGSQAAIDRFLHEARTTARFNHPHIVTIYAASVWRGMPYIALEYLEGQTLRERIDQERLSIRESMRIGLAIAEALEEAHRHKVLHRDLKPANVLLPRDGRLRVVDFSLAKILPGSRGDDSAPAITPIPSLDALRDQAPASEHGAICGTPTYMAPEQWMARGATGATDVWALGVILHELIAGMRPFRGRSMLELRDRMITTEPEPLSSDHEGEPVPEPLIALIKRCLAKDPDQRPSAGEVARSLDQILNAHLGKRRRREEQSPFRGLLPFAERHAESFVGRDAEVAAFLERMRYQGVLPVVGPSGAGKTSFVQAGVIPRLREQANWTVLQLRPGEHPFANLAARLVRGESTVWSASTSAALEQLSEAKPASERTDQDEGPLACELAESPMRLNLALRQLADQWGCRVLIFVDQLEEICTLGASDEAGLRKQEAFIQALCDAGDDPNDPVRVIFTLRDDFLGQLPGGQRVRDALGQVTIIRSPSADALLEIATRPLISRGYRYDDEDLPRQMVTEVSGETAALPLLQFTTQMLWNRRDGGRRLVLRAVYDEIGGVAGALARHADSVLEGLPPDEVQLAREILLRLVTPAGTRKTVQRSALLQELPRAAVGVLDRLVQGRLLTVRRDLSAGDGAPQAEALLELAHESLLSGWGRLARWIEETREELIHLGELTQAAELWARRGHRPEEVWQGDALREAARTVERCNRQVPEEVLRFLELGQRRERRSLQRRRFRLIGGMVLLVLIALAAVIVALSLSRQKRQAEQQRAEAQREGSRAALLRGDLLESRAKLRGSLETMDSALTRLLWWRLSKEPLVWRRSLGAPVQYVAYSPDGKELAAACVDKSVYLFDVKSHALLRVLRGHTDQVLAVAYSPDGRHLASSSWNGEVRLWDLASRHGRLVSGKHAGAVWSVAFSPDGKLLATGSYDKQVRLWRVADGSPVRVLSGHQSGVYGVSFSPDGSLLASASYDKTVRLWRVNGGRLERVIRGHTDTVYRVKFSPDGSLLATSGADRTVRLWRVDTGEPVRVLKGHEAGVGDVAFSPDGALLATSSYDKSIRLWNAHSGTEALRLAGHTAGVVSVSFSPDGRLLASGGRDKSVRLWEIKPMINNLNRTQVGFHATPQESLSHTASVWSVSFSPDGRYVASGSKDESLRLWEVRTGRLVRIFAGHASGVMGVSFSPDGTLLASAGGDNTVRLWEVGTGQQRRALSGHTSEVYAVGFSPDGKLLASGGYDRNIRIWEVNTGRERMLLQGHQGTIWGLDFHPSGKLLASSSYDKTVRIWEVDTGRVRKVLSGHTETVYGVRFSQDGRLLASGSSDKTVLLWDPSTGHKRLLGRYSGRVYWLDIHPDGERVGIPISDGTARIQNLRDGRSVVLAGHRGEVNIIRFSRDGHLAATGSDDGTVRVWDVERSRPHWRAPLMLSAPSGSVWLHSNGSWTRLSGGREQSSKLARRSWHEAVEQRAMIARVDSGGRLLCVGTFTEDLEQWDLAQDRRLVSKHIPGLKQVVALASGCVSLAQGQVAHHPLGGHARVLVEKGAVAVASTDLPMSVLVATRQRVLTLSITGEQRAHYPADVGVSSMARSPDWLVLGYRDGNMELVSLRSGEKRRGFSFEDVPASPVERILIGPMNTLIVGYANGLLGIWNLQSGRRLEHVQLHGPVIHLLLTRDQLYAATELGHHITWDLTVLRSGYCDLLRRVWDKVPVVWRDGRPVIQPPPPGHRCRHPDLIPNPG